MSVDFTDLYNKYYRRVYFAALKIIKDPDAAEDVLQETFIKAYEKLGDVNEGWKIGSWLSTIASRKAIDFLRRDKRLVMMPVDELPGLQTTSPLAKSEVEEEYDRIYFEDRMKKKVSTLPPKLRVVFQLSAYHHMNEKEIACKLDLTNSAVKSRLHRARQSLKRKMKEVKDQDNTA
ncbi:RNA polymerase sigma factor [Halobacillus sp. BBL2006]|uniref:RNA polymerase sigma factor n=1 Tax=Halobacillus sp. BBL2006 TaxID=1543706 RepID=UPI0005431016|nr:RNA polymerase sigma factor [Halobacillus sp. BBL2006]KHE72797.1 hypothetical protein LD39_02675 [Halobacillus sp. BBL2006]